MEIRQGNARKSEGGDAVTANRLTRALLALVNARLGMREAVTLAAMQDGATAREIAAMLYDDPKNVRGRIGSLRRKRLTETKWREDGTVVFHPSKKGMEILRAANL